MKCIHGLQAFHIAKKLVFLLSRYVRSKEIGPTMLDDTRVMSMEMVCLVEDTFPCSILTTQLNLIAFGG